MSIFKKGMKLTTSFCNENILVIIKPIKQQKENKTKINEQQGFYHMY